MMRTSEPPHWGHEQILAGFGSMNIADKTVLVTGSTDGVARLVARRLADQGARVLIHGRDRSEMTRWPRGLRQRMRVHSCQLLRFTASYASRLNSTANG